MKLMKVTGVKKDLKGGTLNLIQGLLYDNNDDLFIGNKQYTVWVKTGKVNFPVNPIGKDLYVEYGPNNSIVNIKFGD